MKRSRILAAAVCSGLLWMGTGVARAADDDLVFAKLDCYSIVSPNEYVFYFGTHSNKTTDAIPAINFFDPGSVVPPPIITPGYTPHVLAVTIDPSLTSSLKWFLGSVTALEIDVTTVPDAKLCGIGLQGPEGDPGPTGPQGDPGPSGLAACQTVSASVPEGIKPAVALANCGPDEQVVSGEAACGKGAITSFGRVGNGWEVRCQRPKGATATALCCVP